MKISSKTSLLIGIVAYSIGGFLLTECVPLVTSPDSSVQSGLGATASHISRLFDAPMGSKLVASRRSMAQGRSITAFVTDPALLVTILHSLEVAYWTLPFGFILQPIINLFRMPNRRRSADNRNADARIFLRKLTEAIEKIKMLQENRNQNENNNKSNQRR